MKAEINGIKFEGTPAEIAAAIKLAGLAKEVQEVIRYVPQTIPSYPYPIWLWQPYPGTAKPYWDRTYTIDCGGTTTSATGTTYFYYNGDGSDSAGAPVPSN